MANINIYLRKAQEALKLALPIILGQLGQVLMGFFDTVQIGGLGHEYIAASGFANGLYWMIILLGMGVLFAVSPLVSEAMGQQRGWKSVSVFRAGLVLAFILSVLFVGILELVCAHLEIFEHSATDNELGRTYLQIVNYSTPFIFLFTAGKQFLDGLERTRVGMFVTIGGLLLNVVLNQALIYGTPWSEGYGIAGAAWATTISRGLMAAVVLFYIYRDGQFRELTKSFHRHKEGREFTHSMGLVLKIGIPAGLQFFWEVAAFNAGQIMSGWISTEAEAAHMIAIGLASITFMVISGISAAGTIMVGFEYGAKNHAGVRLAGNTIFLVALSVEIVFALVFLLLHETLPLLYTQNAEVVRLSASMLLLAAVFQISDGLQGVAAGVLRGMQDVTYPAVIAFISYWLVMIPASYVLAFTFGQGLKGIWIGFIIGLSVAAVLQLWRYAQVSKLR